MDNDAVSARSGYAIGRHMIADFNGCAYDAIATEEAVRTALLKAAEKSGATVVSDSFRYFSPHGVSGFVIISESHFSVHTWPEYSYAAIDIFTCGDSVDFNTAIRTLESEFKAQSVEITADLFRGVGIGAAFENTTPVQLPPKLSWESLFTHSAAWGIAIDIELLNVDIPCAKRLKNSCSEFALSLGFPNLRAELPGGCASEIGLTNIFAGCFNGLQIRSYQRKGSKALYLELLAERFVDPQIAGINALKCFGAEGYRLRVSLRH